MSKPDMKVPFLDLHRINKDFLPKWQEEFEKIVQHSQFVNGSWVSEFEKRFADFVGVKHCIGVSSGLDALTLMLKAKFPPGSKIAVPALTFAATAEAVVHAGMKPFFCDVDDSGLLSLPDFADVDGSVPVYLYGKYFKFDKTPYIADACQAHGAFKSQESCFSFYPAKNLGALGDAGAICTNDDYIDGKCRELREHGQKGKYNHVDIGYTARLDNLQALFLTTKLQHLSNWNDQRIELAYVYYKAFQEIGLQTQCNANDFDTSHVFHIFSVLTPKRKELMAFLDKKGIGYGLHYPTILTDTPCYNIYERQMSLQISSWSSKAQKYASQGLSLPLFPYMTTEEQSYIIENVKEFFST